MQIQALKTHKIKPKESLFSILDNYLPKVIENSIIAITSKIISTCENNLTKKTKLKAEIIKKEADFCFTPPKNCPDFCLTIKNNRLIPNAGIDESNGENFYILLPKDPFKSAYKIWQHLRTNLNINNLGIIITDSNITPLRSGVTGICIGWCGFKPIYDYKNQNDIFTNPLKVTKINLIDSLATAATLVMGEGNEQTPLAIITQAPKIEFQNIPPTLNEINMVRIEPSEDLYAPLLKKKQ